jgi:hypothetical protein
MAETLLVLLHCSVVSRMPNMEFALVPALQLAEGGRKIGARRIGKCMWIRASSVFFSLRILGNELTAIGYLYLCEMMPIEHELRLMLVNTIRKVSIVWL